MRNLLTSQSVKNIRYEGKIHYISYILPLILSIFGLIMMMANFTFKVYITGSLFLLLFIFQVKKLLILKSIKILVTDNELTIASGLLNKKITDISLRKYEAMQLSQSLIGKLLNYGKLTVTTGHITKSYKIKSPIKLREAIIQQTQILKS
ncbi:MAG: PH domain-containing protein [Weeksellaceae bacterium]|nr:PH domain-containing protein [Acholeplasmataceae bacterium]